MIDVRLLRTDLEATQAALARKGVPADEVAAAAALDAAHRRAAARVEDLRGRVNALSKNVGDAMRRGQREEAEKLRAESRQLGDELSDAEHEAAQAEAQLRQAMLRLPNVPAEDAPAGAGPEDNVVVRTVGYDPARYGPHQRVPHWEIGHRARHPGPGAGGQDLRVDVPALPGRRGHPDQGAVPAGPGPQRRRLRRGPAAHPGAHHSLEATGQLPKFADDAYHIERDDLWAVPTAEVPLTSMRATRS